MPNNFWRMILIVTLCTALAEPARADVETDAKLVIAAIVIVTAVVAVTVTVVVLYVRHEARTITGCVASGPGGMSVTDENNKRTYELSGNPAGIKAGERMTLTGMRKRANKVLIFEARSVTKDMGVCHP